MRFAIASLSLIITAIAAAQPTGADIRQIGIEARLHAESRDAKVQEVAAMLLDLAESDREKAHSLQRDFQYAFLLVCDRDIYDTLSEETIAAVDEAMTATYTWDEVIAGDRWDALTYAHGFFNRDVTAEEIEEVAERWAAVPDHERERLYPTFIHVIDAVTKPLAMGPVGDDAATGSALDAAIPLLLHGLDQPAKRGRAFHPPSHACLVIGAIYDHWADHPVHAPRLRALIGSRGDLINRIQGRLIGAQEDPESLPRWQQNFHTVLGLYLANALARLDARSTVPSLKKSLAFYEASGSSDSAIAYTKRALIALGDDNARTEFEAKPIDSEEVIETAAWLVRNGQGETKEYGATILATALKTTPEAALNTYFQRAIDKL